MRTALLTLAVASTVGSIGHACFMRSPQPVQVWLDHINVEITDQIAVKTYNCTFRNPNPRAVVGGTCYMELEPGAQIDDMSVLIDGKEMKAEILSVEKANQVFQEMIKNGGSPALLEYYGNQLIQTQVPRIAPNGTVTVKLTYTTVLKKKGGLVRLQMLNTNPKALMQPLKSASVTVKIKSREPLKNIYSPTHEIKLVEKEGWDIVAEWSQENYMPKHPFVLYYQVAPEPVGASLIAHRELDEEGAFMLMLSPTLGSGSGKVTDEQILPKDVVFCVDTSGSMLADKKMEQARAALTYCIETLRPGDRFNIVDFSTVARHFHDDGLVEFNERTKAKALRYTQKLHARGGTAIQDALELSLKHLGEGDRLKMIVFATDGLPTIGERDPQAILKNMAKKNQQDVRIFVFGEGFDVNTKLLDFLALDHRGEADYILPDENITEKISRFFDRVGSPILTDLKVSFDGLEVKDVFPRKIPDVFRGEQVILYGRYNGHGPKTVRVTGNFAGQQRTLEYTLDFPEYSEDDRHSFVPRLWAGQKVDFLLNEIRKSGQTEPDKELVQEVTYLATRYGIVTPYTSYLVADDFSGRPGGSVGGGGAFGLYRLSGQVTRKLKAGEQAARPSSDLDDAAKREIVNEAKNFANFRRAQQKSGQAGWYYAQAEAYMRQAGRNESILNVMQQVGSRTFYKRGREWQEAVFDPAKHKNIKEVDVGSDEYFALLKQDRRLAKYLSLGDVVFQVRKQWYRFQQKKRS
jgi:Ca-activated chloride channel family protein